MSRLARIELLKDSQRDEVWVNRGTEPDEKSFRAFNIARFGLLLTFDEYQVDCFGAGPQVVELPYEAFRAIVSPRLPRFWPRVV